MVVVFGMWDVACRMWHVVVVRAGGTGSGSSIGSGSGRVVVVAVGLLIVGAAEAAAGSRRLHRSACGVKSSQCRS